MERQRGYRTDWLQDAFSQGEAKGKGEEARAALLRVLSKRGFPVSAQVQARIDAERELARLERWLEAAVDAASIADVFSDA